MKTDTILSDSSDISSCRHSWQENQGLQEIIVKVCDLRTLWHRKCLHMHNKWELYTEKEILAVRNTSATCCLHLWYLNGRSVVGWMGSMHVYYSENFGFKSTSVKKLSSLRTSPTSQVPGVKIRSLSLLSF